MSVLRAALIVASSVCLFACAGSAIAQSTAPPEPTPPEPSVKHQFPIEPDPSGGVVRLFVSGDAYPGSEGFLRDDLFDNLLQWKIKYRRVPAQDEIECQQLRYTIEYPLGTSGERIVVFELTPEGRLLVKYSDGVGWVTMNDGSSPGISCCHDPRHTTYSPCGNPISVPVCQGSGLPASIQGKILHPTTPLGPTLEVLCGGARYLVLLGDRVELDPL